MSTLQQFPFLSVLLLVIFSGTFSAAETALFSLTRFQLKQIKTKTPAIFQKIQYLLDRPASLVATVLIGNECTNVFISHLLATYYDKTLEGNILLVTAINLLTVVPIIFIFGEITPKIIAARTNTISAPILTPILWFFYQISMPIRWLIESAVNGILYIFRIRDAEERLLREEDFLHLVEDIKKKGAIERSEQELIENVLELDDDNALELSSPLSEMLIAYEHESPAVVIERLKRSYAPRIPVLAAPDKVSGILYAKDLLRFIDRDDEETSIKQLMKEPLVISPQMKIDVLFKRFRQLRVHIAVVENKQGRALGCVTMDDILEQMLGELWETELR